MVQAWVEYGVKAGHSNKVTGSSSAVEYSNRIKISHEVKHGDKAECDGWSQGRILAYLVK